MQPHFDDKPYIEHDPLIGYRYVANTRKALPRPGGGTYEMAINRSGIRSNREYTREKPPGVTRLVLLGDSYAAGQYVSNDQRFTELLERRVPNLEIINLALEGTGTDQQLLIYENAGLSYEHDAVIILPFLQNIRRNIVKARASYDPNTHEQVLLPKPWFELEGGELQLRGVPVPTERVKVATADAETLKLSGEKTGFVGRLKSKVSHHAFGKWLKESVQRFISWEPFPEYQNAGTKEWQLMAAILRRLKERAGARPLMIIPVFYEGYLRLKMAQNYRERFAALASDSGIHIVDLLPHFKKLGPEGSKCFQEPYDCHYSPAGHLALADALEDELSVSGLLKR